jgi:ribosomal protein S18 acetylase RimI-like enzyme
MPSIRPARAADRAALEAVLRSDGQFRRDEIAVALELIDAAVAGTDDYRVRLADPGDRTGEVAGYICYGPTPMTRATWDLYWIVTHAGFRGRGVAGALVAHMEADIRGRGGAHIRVETSEQESYGAARSFYDRHGYPEASRLPDFYGPGDALITYYKRLLDSP